MVYATSAGSGSEIDIDNFNQQLTKHGVGQPTVVEAYTTARRRVERGIHRGRAGAGTGAGAKLKDSGVTSVVLLVSTPVVAAMTKAATANEYSPEWLLTGWAYQDLSLFAAQYDQDQSAHAFGMSWFSPYTTGNAGAATGQNVFDWYWGTNKGTTYSGAFPPMYFLDPGIMLAGAEAHTHELPRRPVLAPGAPGARSRPGDDARQQGRGGRGRLPGVLPARPEGLRPRLVRPEGGRVSATSSATSRPGTTGTSTAASGTHSTPWPKGKPKFFGKGPTDVISYTDPPAKDLPPSYPCDGCPSRGRRPGARQHRLIAAVPSVPVL